MEEQKKACYRTKKLFKRKIVSFKLENNIKKIEEVYLKGYHLRRRNYKPQKIERYKMCTKLNNYFIKYPQMIILEIYKYKQLHRK